MAGAQSGGNSLACALALLGSLIHTLLTSTLASLILFVRVTAGSLASLFLNRTTSSEALLQDQTLASNLAPTPEQRGCQLYEGTVRHFRRHPVKHGFKYPVRCAVVDMDSPPAWFVASSAAHHMTADQVREMAGTRGAVHLLTNPVSVGYEQNPISVFFCFDAVKEGQAEAPLALCVAEVTNTPWAERCTFSFDPKGGLPKPLHVSPFMDMNSTWRFSTEAPGDTLRLTIVADHPELGEYFSASLHAQRVQRRVHPDAFLWLMPHRVAFWIYWQALLLWWKGVPLVEHPKYTDGEGYRHRVLARYEKEGHSSCAAGGKRATEANGKVPPGMPPGGCIFRWQDAAGWPWK